MTTTLDRPLAPAISDIDQDVVLEVPTPTLRHRAIAAIMVEANAKGVDCGRRLAREVIFMLRCTSEMDRNSGDAYHLNDEELQRFHPVLEAIMPDDTLPTPGSAFDLVNQLHLLEGQTFFHFKAGEGVVDCAVSVEVIDLVDD